MVRPAHAAGVVRNAIWAAATLLVVVLLLGYKTSLSGPEQTSASRSGPVAGTGSSGSSSTSAVAGSATYVGGSVKTRWGPVQVQITVSGGRIADVSVPVYPDNNGRDRQINAYALPELVQETLDAQSADIDMVSGATVTSQGYVKSLQQAIDKAGL